MQSRMLKPPEFNRLLAATTLAELMQRLVAMDMIPSAALELGQAQKELHQGLIQTTEKLMRFLRRPLSDFFAFFIHTYDLLNLETTISHIHADSEEDIQGLMYDTGSFGMLNAGVCNTATNFAALRKSLRGTILAEPYADGLERFRDDDDLPAFLCFLEQEFLCQWRVTASSCADLLSAAGMKLFSRFTLVTAITSSMRERFCRKAAPALFRRWLETEARAKINTCVVALEHGNPRDAAEDLTRILFTEEEGKPITQEPFALAAMETRLQRLLLEHARKAQLQAGVNPGFLLAFLLRMQIQVRDLIRIMEGKSLGMTPEAIMHRAIGA